MNIDQTYKLKNGRPQYNYLKCLQYMQQQGIILYGSSYRIRPSQRQQLYKLLLYATDNKAQCTLYGIDLKKGLLVTGPENSGKTGLLHLLKPFFQLKQQYLIRSIREVVFCYQRFGRDTLQQYIFHDLPYCFDDLGLEQRMLNNEVLKEVLQFRLSLAANQTHIITRLQKPAIVEMYGNDFSTMLYQSLNYIKLTT